VILVKLVSDSTAPSRRQNRQFGCPSRSFSENPKERDLGVLAPSPKITTMGNRRGDDPMPDDSGNHTSDSPVEIDPSLLALLRCPCQEKKPLEASSTGLTCTGCERSFPVVDGIPVILPESEDSPRD